MPTTAPNGAIVPVGSDIYNLTPDLLRLAKSLNIVIPVNSADDRDNLPDKYEGMTVARLDHGSLQQTYSGGVWYGFRGASGGINVPNLAPGGSYSVNISYFAGTFSGVPRVTVSAPSSRMTASVDSMTATGCRVVFDNHTAAAATGGIGSWIGIFGLYG